MNLKKVAAALTLVSLQSFAQTSPRTNDKPGAAPFFWGVSNSAFQVEGEPAPSDWTRWVQQPGKIHDGSNANAVTHFWRQYDRDFELAQQLGANAFRISIAWERVQPKGPTEVDESALEHYAQIIRSLRSHGLEPVITLHHFTLPTWMAEKGGLTSDDFPVNFKNYVDATVRYFAKHDVPVKWWMTFNEPMILLNNSYRDVRWPPGVRAPKQALIALKNLSVAHRLSYPVIKAAFPNAKVSIAAHYRPFEPKTSSLLDKIATRLADHLFNDQFNNSLITGKMHFWIPGGGWIWQTGPGSGSTLDYFGLNFYGRTKVAFSTKPPFVVPSEGEDGPKSEMGWEIHPPSFKKALEEAYLKYELPILVTENGIADAGDVRRPQFLTDMIAQMWQAKEGGTPILGYMYWSLTDNFEWAEGLAKKFGLVEVNYTTNTLKPRPSFEVYKNIISSHSGQQLVPQVPATAHK